MASNVHRLHQQQERREDWIIPNDLETEQAVLGALLMNNDLWRFVAETLEIDHFHERLHRQIFEVIREMIDMDEVASPITVKVYLGDRDIGGVTISQYLARLSAQVTGVSKDNILSHCRILKDLWLKRRLISICQTAEEKLFNSAVTDLGERVYNEILDQLEELRPAAGQKTDFESFGAVSKRAVAVASALYQLQAPRLGLPTRLRKLDNIIGGLQNTDFIVLAGRPGSGKTALAGNIVIDVARYLRDEQEEGVVAFSSLEMSGEQVTQRMLSDLSGVPFWKIARGKADADEMEAYVEAAREFDDLPIHIDDTGGLSLAQWKLRVRQLHKKKRIRLLVVDYLQLLATGDKRFEEVTLISNGMKAFAKELKIPLIALSQLSRKVDERDDKRPMLSDLRESGAIEQDADIVIFLYREEYYLNKRKPASENSPKYADWAYQKWLHAGRAEVIVAKNRHGGEDTVLCGFSGETVRFMGEVPERGPLPDGSQIERDKKKVQVRLSPKAAIAHHELEKLMLTEKSMQNHDPGKRVIDYLPGAHKLVPYDVWKATVAVQILDPSQVDDEKARMKAMQKICDELMAPQDGRPPWIGRGKGEDDVVYVWLANKGI